VDPITLKDVLVRIKPSAFRCQSISLETVGYPEVTVIADVTIEFDRNLEVVNESMLISNYRFGDLEILTSESQAELEEAALRKVRG
jgi:hypothetical protein